MSDCSWKGIPLEKLCTSFDKPQYPPLQPSSSHTILIKLPVSNKSIPEPYPSKTNDIWNRDFVRLPCSPRSLYPVSDDELRNRWELIQEELLKSISSSAQLETVILSYNSRYAKRWNFQSLHSFFCNTIDENEAEVFFQNILPKLARLALSLPTLLTGGVPLLKQHSSHSITLSQLQIASLLANAFFCTFPSRNTLKQNAEYSNYPDINFNRLFGSGRGDREPAVQEKLKCIMNYFRRVVNDHPQGAVTFSRHYVVKEALPNWAQSQAKLPRLHITSEGTIEDQGFGMLQVDFANKYVGGGVLGLGCVQEEIRFVICPELIISRLFTECLDSSEALIITGCEQYNKYSGYADSFLWNGDHIDTTPVDEFGRRYCTVIALDAINYARNPLSQYSSYQLLRELNKAFVGFSYGPPTCSIATGNWGCGVFGGNAHLKALLQLMAAGYTGRDLCYFTFKDDKLRDSVYGMYRFLCDNKINTGKLYQLLCKYNDNCSTTKNSNLYSFLYSAVQNNQLFTFAPKKDPSISCSKSETVGDKSSKFEPKTVPNSPHFSSNARKKDSSGLSSDEIDCLLSGIDEKTLEEPSKANHDDSQTIIDDSDVESEVNFKERKTYQLSEENDRKVCLQKHRASWNHIDFCIASKPENTKTKSDDAVEESGCNSVDNFNEPESKRNSVPSCLDYLNESESKKFENETPVTSCSSRINKVQLNGSDCDRKMSSSKVSKKSTSDRVCSGTKRKISDYFLPM